MEIAKKILHQLGSWEYTGLCLLVLLTLVMRFSTIMQPNEPLFDEQYYVTDARHILQGEGTWHIEHPPLGKLFIAFGMFLFGDNPFGWRFFSVLFGNVPFVVMLIIFKLLMLLVKQRISDMSFLRNGSPPVKDAHIRLWFFLKQVSNSSKESSFFSNSGFSSYMFQMLQVWQR